MPKKLSFCFDDWMTGGGELPKNLGTPSGVHCLNNLLQAWCGSKGILKCILAIHFSGSTVCFFV